MHIEIRALLAAGGLTLALIPPSYSSAQSSSQQLQARARLERGVHNIESELRGKTGALRWDDLRRQRREIDDAIRRIQTGQPVSAEEIDRILGEVSFERAK